MTTRPRIARFLSTGTLIGLGVIATFSCAKEENSQTGSATVTTTAEDSLGVAVSAAVFRGLRWLEGSWRGNLPKGGSFYERYRFVDDSTIAMRGFADSTFSVANDSASIVLRGGKVYDRGASEWVASRLDSTTIDFTPVRSASNSFTWKRESPDRWTATLKPRKGSPTVYTLERLSSSR